MKRRNSTLILLTFILGFSQSAFTQKSSISQEPALVRSIGLGIPPANNRLPQTGDFEAFHSLSLTAGVPVGKKILATGKDGLPIAISGSLSSELGSQLRSAAPEELAQAYLYEVEQNLQIQDALDEFRVRSIETDQLGQTHIRMDQYYKGVQVYGSELIVHLKNDRPFFLNGRSFPTPKLESVDPSITREEAYEQAKKDMARYTAFRSIPEALAPKVDDPKLVILPEHGGEQTSRLVYEVVVMPNPTNNWKYFIDAQTGAVIDKFNQVCQVHYHAHGEHETGVHVPHATIETPELPAFSAGELDGPFTAQGTDLGGVNRSLNVYETQGVLLMLDVTRPMFNAAQSNLPNDPTGAIWTVDGGSNSPQNNNFGIRHLVSESATWNDPIAVSAHYNAGIAYEYYANTFNRNAIDGRGGTILSIINITEPNGTGMDNAFWNGQAMFYGNGAQAFLPLAGALDVAGHEMSHGVIQNTANLEYRNESGALNESFADIFGAMMDREDWKMGEEVVRRNAFPTGALRDLSNPNNGGNRLGDPGWQPASVNEQYFGSQDNGGVHINSGIPNHAFYLFATEVGRDIAEQVFYRALSNYLTRSSQFTDLRIAVVKSIEDLYPSQAQQLIGAAATAFDQVGIDGPGGNYEEDLEVNTGTEFMILTGADNAQDTSSLNVVNPRTGDFISVPLGGGNGINTLSQPSITDDGELVVYVGQDRHIYIVQLQNGQLVEGPLQISTAPEWRRVVVSKDGSRLAAVTRQREPVIHLFDFTGEQVQQKAFELFNPTTAPDNQQRTSDVEFADAMEFSPDGQYVIYDANNVIPSFFGNDVEYFDVGILEVWDNNLGTFAEGQILKVFGNIEEGLAVGNPALSKNSPYIFTVDVLDQTNGESFILGVNFETGEIGGIHQNPNNVIHYGNYSPDDQFVSYTTTSGGVPAIAAIQLAEDKINAANGAQEQLLFTGARWPVWYAQGERSLVVDTDETSLNGSPVQVMPNPFQDALRVQWEQEGAQQGFIQVFDMFGRSVYREQSQLAAGLQTIELPLNDLPAGTYLMNIRVAGDQVSRKIVKQ